MTHGDDTPQRVTSFQDAVMLIHRQLECLKYVGRRLPPTPPPQDGMSHHASNAPHDGQSTPCGEGINMDILLLPDLVFDFCDYNRKKEPPGKICAVGGRAARIASTLAHLLDENDGTFRVHLATKTHVLGRVLLETEFAGQDVNNVLRLDCVVDNKSQPRCSLLPKASNKPEPSQWIEADELSAQDLELFAIKRAIEKARTVCVSSLAHQPLHDLALHLFKTMRDSQSLFLDLAGCHYENLTSLLDKLSKLCKRRKPLSGVFVPLDDPALEWDAKGNDFYGHQVTTSVFGYTRKGELKRFDRAGRVISSLVTKANFGQINVAERFKAGVLLASSVESAILDIQEDNRLLFRALQTQWEKDSTEPCGDKILEYGAALAEGPSNLEAEYFSASQLEPPTNADLPITPSCVSTTMHSGVNTFYVNPNHVNDFFALASRRRSPGTRFNLLFCTTEECSDCPWHGSSSAGQDKVRGAVLIDLDGTLLNSKEQRDLGLASALKVLLPQGSECSIDDEIKFFQTEVYDRWRVFEAMGCGNFRQEWNHPGWYAGYCLFRDIKSDIANDSNKWGNIRLDLKALDTIKDADKRRTRLRMLPYYKLLNKHYKDKLSDERVRIEEARKAFDNVHMSAFKEARDLLKTLTQCKHIKVYIASEGDPDTQQTKLRRSGLDGFVHREVLLTTEDAAKPDTELRQLEIEQERLESQRKSLQQELDEKKHLHTEMTVVEMELRQGARTSRDQWEHVVIRDKEKHIQDILDIKDRLSLVESEIVTAGFVQKVLARMAKKGGRSFYAAVVRAILRDPNNPLDKLRQFRTLIDPIHPQERMKFVMVGDRQDNDIAPPIDLLTRERVFTIRLSSPDHHQENCWADKDPDSEGSRPHLVTCSLSQVKAVLLSASTWHGTKCANDPPVFGWKLHARDAEYAPESADTKEQYVGLNRLLCGIAMDRKRYPLINMICSAILVEIARSYPKEHLRAYYDGDGSAGERHTADSNPTPLDESVAFSDMDEREIRRNVRILCAIVRRTELNYGFQEIAESVMNALTKFLYSLMALERDEDDDVEYILDTLVFLRAKGTRNVVERAAASTDSPLRHAQSMGERADVLLRGVHERWRFDPRTQR